MVQKKQYIEKRELLYLIALFAYMSCVVFSSSIMGGKNAGNPDLIKLMKLVRYGAYSILAVKLMYEQYRKNDIIYSVMIVMILILNVIAMRDKVGLFFAFFIIMAKDVRFDKIIRITVTTQIFVMALVIVLCKLGYIVDYVYKEKERIRHGLGFSWVTTPPILCFFITVQIIYLRKKNMRIWEYLVLGFANVYFYIQTKTRVTFFLICIIMTVFFLYSKVPIVGKALNSIKNVYVFLPSLICVISLYLHISYNPNDRLMAKINSFMNNRLRLGKEGYDKYGITLLGQQIKWVGNGYQLTSDGYNYVDCSYLQILLNSGIAILILIMLMYTFMVYKSVKENDIYLCGILLFVLLFCITEPKLYDIVFNPFPLYAGNFFSQMNFSEKKEKTK